MQPAQINLDITTILAIIGGVLGVTNTIILIFQYFHSTKQAHKVDLSAHPNFDITLLYSDKIRNAISSEINEIADIEEVPFDTVDMELNVVGGVATNLKFDVTTLLDLHIYGLTEGPLEMPLKTTCISINFFGWDISPIDSNKYLKRAEGNVYKIHLLTSLVNAKLKERYPVPLVFATACPQYYTRISYIDSYKKQQEYFLHNNHPISADAYKENINEHKCFVDFNGNFSENIIEHIINQAFPENQ